MTLQASWAAVRVEHVGMRPVEKGMSSRLEPFDRMGPEVARRTCAALIVSMPRVEGFCAAAQGGKPVARVDHLVRADPANASRVYRALAAFGAPLQSFDVSESDFATYDGVLQIGLPPRRIDILNRASGIGFEEATASGDGLELEGRRIPFIGLDALLRNKRAAGREQDLADVKALEAIAKGAR